MGMIAIARRMPSSNMSHIEQFTVTLNTFNT